MKFLRPFCSFFFLMEIRLVAVDLKLEYPRAFRLTVDYKGSLTNNLSQEAYCRREVLSKHIFSWLVKFLFYK